MNKGQKIGLGLNFIGLVLFVIWFIVRNIIPTSVSLLFAFIFLGLLAASLVIMIRATKLATQETTAAIKDKKI
jgi:F0F1-type ATP synthase assembly protein I